MDPMMMQMMMQMMQNSQQQAMPQMPQQIPTPQIQQPATTATTGESVDWQAQMQEFRDRADTAMAKDDDQRLVNAFIPAEDEEESSLLTETDNA